MILKKPSWAENLPEASAESSPSNHNPQTPVVELVFALKDQRLNREVALALRTGLRDAQAEFGFMRVRGLNSLVKFLASSAKSQRVIELFQDSQSYQDLQVVPALFGHTLASHKWAGKAPGGSLVEVESPPREVEGSPIGVESPPTCVEKALALRVLEGCCLLDSASRISASRYGAVSELMDLFLAGGPSEQRGCLDCLLAVMLDSPINQKEFERVNGLGKIADFLRNDHLDATIRIKIAEFIVVLVGHVLSPSRPSSGVLQEEGQKSERMAKWAHQALVEVLGADSSPVVDAIIEAGPTSLLDAEPAKFIAFFTRALAKLKEVPDAIIY